MKILIIAGIFPPDIGGPSGYIFKLCQSLKKRGHNPVVLTYSDTPEHSIDKVLDYKVIRINRKSFILWRELKTIIYGLKYSLKSDLIYSNGNDFKAMIIGLLTLRKRIHKIVGDVSWERAQNRGWYKGTIDQYQFDKKPIKLKFLDFIRALPIITANRVITPSSYLRKIVIGWGVNDSKISVIYNAYQALPISENISFEKLELLKKNDLKLMVTICRLVPWKGVDGLIKVLKKFPNLALVVVGDGWLLENLKELATRNDVQNRVVFLGRVERDKLSRIFELSDLFILNSSYEGLPHVVLEAMSCKKLVLASAVGGTVEVVQDKITGLTFEYANEQEIADAIEIALKDDNSELIKQASQFLTSKFSYETMIDETEKEFNKLCY